MPVCRLFVNTESSPTIEDICLQAVQRVEDLMAQTRGSSPFDDSGITLGEVQMMLAALPLNTDEFGLATNHLRNANRCLRSQELGAACHELRLLARSLIRNRHYRGNGRRDAQCTRSH